MFGSTGGLIEFRASLLASHGFAAFALAYWAYDDLPSYLEKIDLEYFEEGIKFLLRHPKVILSSLVCFYPSVTLTAMLCDLP